MAVYCTPCIFTYNTKKSYTHTHKSPLFIDYFANVKKSGRFTIRIEKNLIDFSGQALYICAINYERFFSVYKKLNETKFKENE